ncbi:hypothetical protein pb186bvf_010367 [Paramecium bursaria]
MRILFCTLIAISLASNAYIYPFKNVEPNNLDGLTQQQIAQLIKYNLGLAEHPQPDQRQDFEQMIISYGKGNMLAPTDMSYLILLQSEKLFQAKEQERITEGYSAQMKIIEKNEKSITDILFSDHCTYYSKLENSLIERAQEIYRNPNLPFLIYQNEDDLDINLLQWTITLYLGKNNEVFFYEPKKDKSYKMESSLEKCVDFFFGTTFDYAPTDDKVYKYNTNEMINITPENKDLFLAFFKDICAMNKLSQIFKKGADPNFLVVINKSVAKLEKILPENDINLVYDMMRIAHKKLSKNLKNYFDGEDLFGMILVEEEKIVKLTTTKESAQQQRILMETRTRMLDGTVSQVTASQQMAPGVYQIYFWTGIFFAILLLSLVYAMVNMDIQKDTLLYAKFLTNDQRN